MPDHVSQKHHDRAYAAARKVPKGGLLMRGVHVKCMLPQYCTQQTDQIGSKRTFICLLNLLAQQLRLLLLSTKLVLWCVALIAVETLLPW